MHKLEMLFSTTSSYTLPQLYVEDRSRTPSLLSPDTLSTRDRQIRLYCQTIIGLVSRLHSDSLNCIIRLQKRLQRILDIKTHIDLTENEAKLHFEHNLQLFICMVDHRLRTLAVDCPLQYELITKKLQLLLIECGSVKFGKASADVRDLFSILIHKSAILWSLLCPVILQEDMLVMTTLRS
ncbi:hypothetical protein RB195_013204 [Necator americanus]|uniref:Uncharacterized protein n=1 Tax=Necator americanus TaxID=51031 RepID=A0ABR1DUL8_NECAM